MNSQGEHVTKGRQKRREGDGKTSAQASQKPDEITLLTDKEGQKISRKKGLKTWLWWAPFVTDRPKKIMPLAYFKGN